MTELSSVTVSWCAVANFICWYHRCQTHVEISAAQFDLKPTGQLNLLQKCLPFIVDTKFTFNEPLSKQMNFVIKKLAYNMSSGMRFTIQISCKLFGSLYTLWYSWSKQFVKILKYLLLFIHSASQVAIAQEAEQVWSEVGGSIPGSPNPHVKYPWVRY